MAAFCLLVLVDCDAIGVDDTVADHWPEFARAGKQRVTVRQALSHQEALVALRDPEPPGVLFDWERATALLAATAISAASSSGAQTAGRSDVLARTGGGLVVARPPHRHACR